MKILKNRTVLGGICIVLALVVSFIIAPLLNTASSATVAVLEATKDISMGEQLNDSNTRMVEVGAHNLSSHAIKDEDIAKGQYASMDMLSGDIILDTKIADRPISGNSTLYNLTGEQQAISVTIKNFANGLSGKLIAGDIVTVVAPDYHDSGTTEILPELQYVEVIAVTAENGYDTDNSMQKNEDGERDLAATVTLLVDRDQAKLLANMEKDGVIHLALAYRGSSENAEKFLKEQKKLLDELHPKTEKKDKTQGKDE
ncbi:MAG: Flp pilus assembly protein CpaB [[Clostridium] innocuum]|nr:Flp pilus assembly protein CpaB [[Clostridium] innocuum]MBS5685884.1 Flp pilus assembly protein CpaB [[Clostridium] innocuum]